jgi:hypothetical protein
VTSVLSYGVRLALVLGHAGVDVPVRVLAHILFSASCVCGGVGDFVLDNVRADGRLEDIGQGVGVLAAAPSAPMIVTVGRDILTTVWLVGAVRMPAIVDSSRLRKVRVPHFAPTAKCGIGLCTLSARDEPDLAPLFREI